jgi:hypothetical protein
VNEILICFSRSQIPENYHIFRETISSLNVTILFVFLWRNMKTLLPVLASRPASLLASNSASVFPFYIYIFAELINTLSITPITVTSLSMMYSYTVFYCSTLKSWVRISLGAWLHICASHAFMLSCIGRGLATGWSPVRGALVNVCK